MAVKIVTMKERCSTFLMLFSVFCMLLTIGCIQASSSPFVEGEGLARDAVLDSAQTTYGVGDAPEVQENYPVADVDLKSAYSEDLANEDATLGIFEESKLPGGAVYTRWGYSQCASGSELVYAGTIGGSYAGDDGGGSDYLCMPSEPIYDEVETTAHSERGYVLPTEYVTSGMPSRLSSVTNESPTCAVCRAPYDCTTSIMVPGRNVCPTSEWRLEYRGYLMSTKYTYDRTEFICVDREVQTEPGTIGYQGGSFLYPVESRCIAGGGLPCNPYVHGYELTCAVCSI